MRIACHCLFLVYYTPFWPICEVSYKGTKKGLKHPILCGSPFLMGWKYFVHKKPHFVRKLLKIYKNWCKIQFK